MQVREIAQRVSTLEDNDDLTYAVLSAGRRDLHMIAAKSTMYVTDARIAFVQNKVKNPNERVVGHIRYPWVDAIVWRPRLGRFKPPMLEVWMHENFPVKHLGSWHHYVELEFDDSVDTAAIALDLARRVAAHNLAYGAPARIHDRLREQSEITRLPQLDDTGMGLWECPASVPCTRGAEYIGDSPPATEWICRGGPALDAEPVAEPAQRAPSTIILKRMLARGNSIARERGHDQVGVDDLLLALLIDDDTPVGRLMERHGADYDSVKRQLEVNRPWSAPRAAAPGGARRDRIRVGKRKLPFTIALELVRTMRDIGRKEALGDHEGALGLGQRLITSAERSGISTLRAFAHVQVADSCSALGRFDEAHRAFAAAARLRSAPALTVGPFVPEIDPIEVVDEALYGLWEVADKRNDEDKTAEIAALEALREFRIEYGSDETAAWTAAQLARTHGRGADHAGAARWGEIAREEYLRAGNIEDAADAAEIVAKAHNESGESEHALRAAEQAIEGAVLSNNKRLEVFARFERARANTALRNITAARDEFLALLPEQCRQNPSMARAMVIQLAEIDVLAAADYAIQLAEVDVAFHGPRSAEITLAAARSLDAEHVDQARRLLIHSVRFVAGVLTHPSTVETNVDRGFTTLAAALTGSDDPQFRRCAVQILVDPLRLIDPARLFRLKCFEFLDVLDEAGQYDVLAALARPIVDRLAAAVASEGNPAVREIIAVVRRQWKLCRGLKLSGQWNAALEVHEDLIGWARKAAEISSSERSRLGLYLASHGSDLIAAKRYPEAHDRLNEALDLLRSLMSEGEECTRILVLALQTHARLAVLSGDHTLQQSRLREALAVLGNADSGDWIDETRTHIQALIKGDAESPATPHALD
ncbi:Clp protease N-terminal domain-containing protein [Nocardia sp. NPDC004068]|uniref:Clp protease N-terminal domain-containing protein n=1 Tax=Nocardia sp. NPDC004068 TaxID=3364303 RepID=UPI0036743275